MARDSRELAGAWARYQRVERVAPDADLAPFVERLLIVEWDYDEPYRQVMLPFPTVNLTLRTDRPAEVHGVTPGHIERILTGRARMIAVTFRPGGFRTLLDAPVSSITGRTLPVTAVPRLPADDPGPSDVDAVQHWLRAARPRADPAAGWAADIVAAVAADPALTRVDQVAERFGCGVRRLQRVFAEYVGVPPKWVIRRYRLHEVTERLVGGGAVEWAALAAELGYADQAHLVREFTAMFGESPTHYAARY